MNQAQIEKQLIQHEGERLKPYTCTAGKMTIGVGRNLEDKGISRFESRVMLKNDIAECFQDLSASVFPDHFDRFPENIQHVLIDMRFQLGPGGIRGFKNMIAAFKQFDTPRAIKEMKDSAWYRQTQNRADNLIKMLSEG